MSTTDALGEYLRHAAALADAVEDVLPRWVLRCVEQRCQDAGRAVDEALRTDAGDTGLRCRNEVAPELRALVLSDPDDQRGTPLTLLRDAVRFPTAVLRRAGVEPVARDDFDVHAFPDDVYALVPASFSDVDPVLHEPGLVWGAAKAHVHLVRRRSEGR